MMPRGVAGELAIFSRARLERDGLPAELARNLRDAHEDSNGTEDTSRLDEEPGQLLIEESRLALESASSFHFDHYLVPTRNGWICQVVVSPERGYEASACDSALNQGIAIANYEPVNTSLIFFGIVEDRVASVTVSRGAEARDAAVGENAFLVEMPGSAVEEKYPRLIALKYVDGWTRTLELDPRSFLRINLSGE